MYGVIGKKSCQGLFFIEQNMYSPVSIGRILAVDRTQNHDNKFMVASDFLRALPWFGVGGG